MSDEGFENTNINLFISRWKLSIKRDNSWFVSLFHCCCVFLFFSKMSQVRYFFLAILSWLDLDAVPNLSPPDQAPMLFDSPTERNLFVDRSADRRRQADLGQIGLDGNDASAGGERADVHHQPSRSWKASKLWRPSCRPPFGVRTPRSRRS